MAALNFRDRDIFAIRARLAAGADTPEGELFASRLGRSYLRWPITFSTGVPFGTNETSTPRLVASGDVRLLTCIAVTLSSQTPGISVIPFAFAGKLEAGFRSSRAMDCRPRTAEGAADGACGVVNRVLAVAHRCNERAAA